MTTSTADVVDIEKMAYSVDEYAKQAVSGFKNVTTRAECGRDTSRSNPGVRELRKRQVRQAQKRHPPWLPEAHRHSKNR